MAVVIALLRSKVVEVGTTSAEHAATLLARLAAKEAAYVEVEKERDKLQAKLQSIETWYETARDTLEEEVKDAYDRLATDPDAMDAKLDELLGADEGSGREGS